jgi:hypothetical protein
VCLFSLCTFVCVCVCVCVCEKEKAMHTCVSGCVGVGVCMGSAHVCLCELGAFFTMSCCVRVCG